MSFGRFLSKPLEQDTMALISQPFSTTAHVQSQPEAEPVARSSGSAAQLGGPELYLVSSSSNLIVLVRNNYFVECKLIVLIFLHDIAFDGCKHAMNDIAKNFMC